MPAAKKAVAGREGTGVGGCQHQVTAGVDEGLFLPGVGAPEQKHHGLLPSRQQLNDPVGENLRANAPGGGSLSGPHRENGVQQQDAMLCPVCEAAVGRGRDPQIIPDFLVDVLKGGGNGDALLDRKGQSMGLSRSMIGVLSQNDHPGILKGGIPQGVENIIHGGVDGAGKVFLLQDLPQLQIVVLFKFVF